MMTPLKNSSSARTEMMLLWLLVRPVASGSCLYVPSCSIFPFSVFSLRRLRHIMTCLPRITFPDVVASFVWTQTQRFGVGMRFPCRSISEEHEDNALAHIHSPQMTGLGFAFLIRSAECRKAVFLAPSSLISFIPSFSFHAYPEHLTAAFRVSRLPLRWCSRASQAAASRRDLFFSS